MQSHEVLFRCWSRQSTSVIGVRQGESAKNVLLVMVNGLAVGGGFFYLPGKAVTAAHNLPASHR